MFGSYDGLGAYSSANTIGSKEPFLLFFFSLERALTDNWPLFFPFSRPPPPNLQVVLHAGDVLYHPPGYWHQVTCEEDSISINISLAGKRWGDFVLGSLGQVRSARK